ncbi:peptidoglycan-binding protein [Tepidamorphus sp. 3E244]|uniref:peptidoglycan-binding protein n=1 Tax=Tepidamorphus sp. 3E244 TaxID=3385498 RepID=UPI0038FC8AC9
MLEAFVFSARNSKARVFAALAFALAFVLSALSVQQARAADEIAGSFTQSATYDCRTNTVRYDIKVTIPPEIQAAVQAEGGGQLVLQITSDLPVGLKWISSTMVADGIGLGAGGDVIESRLRDSDRLNSNRIALLPVDANGDGDVGTIHLTGIAEVQPGMPLPHTFAHKANLDVLIHSGGGFIDYALGLESEPPGGGLGTITKTGTPTEVTVDPDACVPDPADPGRPDRGDACLSGNAVVYCGEKDGEYTVIVSGETTSTDFVVVSVLTPGVSIDVMGSLETEVAVPAIAGTYYTELAIVGATPGSAITLSVDGGGDVGVVEDLPDGFALCCSTELVVVIPPECEDRPGGDPDPQSDWDLELEKIYNGQGPCNGGEACDFKIRVTNLGPDPHKGDIKVVDSAEGKPFVFAPVIAPAPWACVGDETMLECTYPDADLPVNGFVELPVRVISTLKKLGPVEVENCAEIDQRPGSKDNNASNDEDCAKSPMPLQDGPDDKVPPPQPDPEPDPEPQADPKKDLSIRKVAPGSCQANGDCTFTLTVRNESQDEYNGDLVISDVPAGPGITYEGHSPSDWDCVQASNGIACSRPDTVLAPGESVSLAVTLGVPNNTTLRRDGLENCGYLGGEAAGSVRSGADTRAVQQALDELGYDPGPVDGLYGGQTAAALRRFQENNGLPVTGTITPDTLDRLGLTGDDSLSAPFVDDFADDNAYCVTTKVTAPPAPKCDAGETLKNGQCVSVCKRGTEWRNGRCRPVVVNCPSGQEYRNGRCRDIVVKCPPGTEFRNGRCRTVRVDCPAGQELRNGQCRPIVCPRGQRLVNGRCVPILVFCKPGETLINGKCVKPQICPPGTQMRNGKCRPIRITCPRGQQLVNGRCRPIVITCPPGTQMRNGKCQPIRITCPRGQELRNGRCRPVRTGPSEINPQQTRPIICKRGETLVNGRCVRAQIRIPNIGTIQIQ